MKKKILVADDDRIIRTFISNLPPETDTGTPVLPEGTVGFIKKPFDTHQLPGLFTMAFGHMEFKQEQ